jgi:hypothetical protein
MSFTEEEAAEVRSVSQDEDTGRPVRVRWVDSGLGITGWKQMKDMPSDVSHCESVGLWMGENDRIVMIGGSRDDTNDNWNEAQLIWKPSIISKEWLS